MGLRAKFNPSSYCPICGVYVGRDYDRHRCRAAVLAAIDAAHAREDDDRFRGVRPRLERLSDGFRMMRGAER